MSKRLLGLSLVAVALPAAFALATPASAQPEPFGCVDQAFMVQNQNAQLSQINQTASPFTFVNVGGPAGIEYNNLGYRTTDGYLYAVRLTGSGSLGGNRGFVRIGQNGVYEELGWPGYPAATAPWGGDGFAYPRFDAGDISSDGTKMYVTVGAFNTPPGTCANPSVCSDTLHILDLTGLGPPGSGVADLSALVSSIPITGPDGNVNDWAYNSANDLLYGGDAYDGQVAVLNPATGVRTDYAVTGLPSNAPGTLPAFGGAWFNASGRLYLYRNNGEIYGIDLGADLLTPTIVSVQTGGPASGFNDGAACAEGIGSEPLIVLEKTVTTSDGTCPGGEVLAIHAGDTVKYCYVVRNTATIGDLFDVVLVDDAGTPGDPGDDFVVTLAGLTDEDGDAAADDLAAEATATGEALVTHSDAGTVVNTATVSGTDVVGEQLTDSDIATVIAEEPPAPGLSVMKTVTTADGDCPGSATLTITAGDTVKYCYVVTNTGTGALFNVALVDDAGTPGDPGDDFVVTLAGLTDEDTDAAADDLATGATATGEALITLTDAGTVVNTATATGDDGQGGDLSDQHSATVTVEAPPTPTLNVSKTVTTAEGTCPGVEVLTVTAGQTVKYCYEVSNSGTGALFNVALVDDAGTPGDPGDDFVVTLAGLTDEDADAAADDLAAGATATGEELVTLGDDGTVVNTATATGDDGRGGELMDSDTATVTPPCRYVWTIEKSVLYNGSPVPDPLILSAGQQIVLNYTIELGATLEDSFGTGQCLDECVTIEDTFDACPWPIGRVCVGDMTETDGSYSKSWSYSRVVGPYYTCGEYMAENIASFTTEDTATYGSAAVIIPVSVPCGGCTLTPGYWKTHSMYGPAPYDDTWAAIGEDTPFFLSGQTWYEVLWTSPVGGNAYYILAQAYIAAELNVINGASSPTEVDEALAWAVDFFSTYEPDDRIKGALRRDAVAYATLLDEYNNGYIGPGHCTE